MSTEQTPRNYEGRHAPIRRRKVLLPAAYLTMKLFEGRMGKKGTLILDPYDEKVVLASREGRELVQNDGTKTYVVHSTSPEKAKSIMRDGLKFRGKWGKPTIPDLHFIGLMLAGPKESQATERNIHYLAYRHEHEANSIKLVYELNGKNPGTSQENDPFAGTFLDHADGVNIEQLSEDGEGLYRIPPERLKGYFDLQEGTFVPNANFVPVANDSDTV